MIVETKFQNANVKRKIKKLSDFKIGEMGKVIEIHITNKALKRHLLDMGLVRGTIVTIKKIAPMGDPIDIELRDYELCVRRSDLSQIDAEVIR